MLRVEKAKVPVVIYTAMHRIEGTYFAHPGTRLIDDLNGRQKQFVPLTDVRVTYKRGGLDVSFTCEFMAVGVQSIVLFCPNPKTIRTANREKEAKTLARPLPEPALV